MNTNFRYIVTLLLLTSGALSTSIAVYIYGTAQTWADCIMYVPFNHLFILGLLGVVQIITGIWAFIKFP